MSLVQQLEERLREYPHVHYTRTRHSIRIAPADRNGFSVRAIEPGFGPRRRYRVRFEGWHGAFKTEREALDFVLFGLSPACRLRVARRGGRPYEWIVECLEDAHWRVAGMSARLFYRYWSRIEVLYYQNRLTPPDTHEV
ncbi:MAG TPA: hypothetical protein VJV75_01425 [Candidatus Polarisedimenticolia bacterium]|nr:hypothetical protein [Candidatus Polarisedimenticolia bacterium]